MKTEPDNRHFQVNKGNSKKLAIAPNNKPQPKNRDIIYNKYKLQKHNKPQSKDTSRIGQGAE